MSKLAKIKGGAKRLGHLAYRGGDKITTLGTGGIGGRIVRHGVHGVLGLASKTYDSLGPIPIRPDAAGVLAGLVMMMFGKDKTKKLGANVADGAVSACISRLLYQGATNFVFTAGPDGKVHVTEGKEVHSD